MRGVSEHARAAESLRETLRPYFGRSAPPDQRLLRQLVRSAADYHGVMLGQCNGVAGKILDFYRLPVRDQNAMQTQYAADLESRKAVLQSRIRRICCKLGRGRKAGGIRIVPVFSGDPRGACVYLSLPGLIGSGGFSPARYDDWGGRGFTVPHGNERQA